MTSDGCGRRACWTKTGATMRYLCIMLPLLAGCSLLDDLPPPDLPEVDAGRPVPDGGVGNCGDSWVLTYTINGQFYITDTTAGMGDADRPLDEGQLTLRVPDEQGAPAMGKARILSFSHGENFTITAFGIETATAVTVTATTRNGTTTIFPRTATSTS